jgi:hypothetical protein
MAHANLLGFNKPSQFNEPKRTKGVSLALIFPQNAVFILSCSESKIRLQRHTEQLICFAY